MSKQIKYLRVSSYSAPFTLTPESKEREGNNVSCSGRVVPLKEGARHRLCATLYDRVRKLRVVEGDGGKKIERGLRLLRNYNKSWGCEAIVDEAVWMQWKAIPCGDWEGMVVRREVRGVGRGGGWGVVTDETKQRSNAKWCRCWAYKWHWEGSKTSAKDTLRWIVSVMNVGQW